jgi:hypothetical protein
MRGGWCRIPAKVKIASAFPKSIQRLRYPCRRRSARMPPVGSWHMLESGKLLVPAPARNGWYKKAAKTSCWPDPGVEDRYNRDQAARWCGRSTRTPRPTRWLVVIGFQRQDRPSDRQSALVFQPESLQTPGQYTGCEQFRPARRAVASRRHGLHFQNSGGRMVAVGPKRSQGSQTRQAGWQTAAFFAP